MKMNSNVSCLKAGLATALVRAVHWLERKPISREQGRWLDLQAKSSQGMADARKLLTTPHPLFGRMPASNYQSPSVSTDCFGFRTTISREGAVQIDNFRDTVGQPVSVLAGNSVAFGMGASSDKATIASQLNALMPEGPTWINLSLLGAPTFRQEREAALIYGPRAPKAYVAMSGCIDLHLCMTGHLVRDHLYPSMGDRMYDRLWKRRSVLANPDNRGLGLGLLMKETVRELEVIARMWSDIGTRVLYALQPIYPWTKKATGDTREKQLIDAFYTMPGGISLGYRADVLGPYHEEYAGTIRTACHKLGVDFIDLNSDDVLSGPEWIFLDPVHLTDLGQLRVAERIATWLQSEGDASG